jgi:hypothetical protein
MLREKIARYIYDQEMDSRYHNFITWKEIKEDKVLKYTVDEYLKRASAIILLIKECVPEKYHVMEEFITQGEPLSNRESARKGFNNAVDLISERLGER